MANEILTKVNAVKSAEELLSMKRLPGTSQRSGFASL